MKKILPPFALAVLLGCSPSVLLADALDELLKPQSDVPRATDLSADKEWNDVVDAFRRNDMQVAVDLGNRFLRGNFRTSPYQILGVRVMINLANENLSVTSSNQKTKGNMDSVMAERAAITAKYNSLNETIRVANATIDRITLKRTQAVQQGTAAHRECVRAAQIIDVANAELEALQPEIEKNRASALEAKTKLGAETKADMLKLLDMLMEADEIEAAFAIANVYLRKAAEDLDVAKKQQDVIRLREVHDKAIKIAGAISDQQRGLLAERKFWTARDNRQKALTKVKQQAGNQDLIRIVLKITATGGMEIDSEIAKAESETQAIRELAEIDPKKAGVQISLLQTRYPDHPELNTLRLRLAISESKNMQGKLSELVSAIETLADSDPEQALSLLSSIEGDKIDDVERKTVEVRISSASNKAVSACLIRAERSLAEVKAKIGGEVAEIVAKEVAKVRNQDGDFVEATASRTVRAKIDRTAEIPEARATLEGISKSLAIITGLKITTQQQITLQGLQTESRILLAALQ